MAYLPVGCMVKDSAWTATMHENGSAFGGYLGVHDMTASMWRWDYGKAVMVWAVILISEESMQRRRVWKG